MCRIISLGYASSLLFRLPSMPLHYYTLSHIARELQDSSGMFLTECFTQERNTLHCVFESGSRTRVLEAHLDSRHGAVFVRSEFHRARKNTLDLFPDLIGRTLHSASLLQNERIIELHLPPYTLHLIVFAGWSEALESASANALVTQTLESEGQRLDTITSAFRTPQPLVGTVFRVKAALHRPLQECASEATLGKALASCDLLLGSKYAPEAMTRISAATGLEASEMLGSEAVRNQMETIERIASGVREECLSATAFFVVRDARTAPLSKPLFSLVRPTDSSVHIEYECSSASEAVRTTVMALHREARFHGLYSASEANLRTSLAKAERTVQAIGRDTEGAVRSKERQLWAELLLSQPNVQQKGVKQLEAQNWDGEMICIPLNPALSLRENADEYFKKASTARETLKKREARREQQERLVRRFTEALLMLRSISTEKDLEKFMTTFSKNAKNNVTHNSPQSPQRQSEKQQGEKHQKTTRFREFPLDDDHTLYVGKTAADNDELTLRFAKPQDYWFHARGVPGSHAILRAPSKDKKPPKHVLEQAASIAAYFSKARNAKMSPVAYTQKKYVRKPKGAAVGAVVLEREEVVMVRPHVPAGLLGTEAEE